MLDALIEQLNTQRNLCIAERAELLEDSRVTLPYLIHSRLLILRDPNMTTVSSDTIASLKADFIAFVLEECVGDSPRVKLQRLAAKLAGSRLLDLQLVLNQTEATLLEKRRIRAFHE